MKNFFRLLGIVALVAVFLSCEGPAGPQGPGGPQGPTGNPVFHVYDSSNPPQRLGEWLEGGFTATTVVFATSSGAVVQFNALNGAPISLRIEFSEHEQQGYAGVQGGGHPNRMFFNPHGGGTWYRFTDDFPNDTITIQANTGSSFDLAGEPITGWALDITRNKVQTVDFAATGLPALDTITAPLVVRW